MTNQMYRSRSVMRVRVALLTAALALCTAAALTAHATTHAATSITGLHVQGNKIVNGSKQPLSLLGVDRSGTEYACIQGWGIFDGPSDATSIQEMASWHINAVRVPLNEDCWLGINGATAAYSGVNYQNAIINYVDLLNQYGLVAILDLHWNAPGTTQATGQEPMPDEDHSPAFWESVASTFKSNSSVIFDLYNEPYPDSNSDTTAGWQCWRDGHSTGATTCPGVSYTVAGMQELVTDVRQTGAKNILMLGGLEYSNSLTQWLTYEPTDPSRNLAASWHSYNFNVCSTVSCWNNTIAPVARRVPIVAGEIGESDCAQKYIDPLMNWMDAHQVSYLAWTWDTWDCSSGPALITSYSGTPTAYGAGFQVHLAKLAANPTATATPTPTVTP